MGAEQSTTDRARTHRRYRSGSKRSLEEDDTALERALNLLRDNDFSNIANARFPKIRGPVSWAKLGEYCCTELIKELGTLRSKQELRDVTDNAKLLSNRLQVRDNVKGARTTQPLRNQITQIAGLTAALMEIAQIQTETSTPTFEMASRATTIRQRWSRLEIKENPWVVQLMEHCVAQVLASNASAGIKAAFNRLLLHWLPPPPTATGGTRIQFDSDDEDF